MSSCLQSTGILLSLDALAEVLCLLSLCWHSRGGTEISWRTIYYFKTWPCLDLQSCCSDRITFLTPVWFFFLCFQLFSSQVNTGKQSIYGKKLETESTENIMEQNLGIIESFRLEKTAKIMESKPALTNPTLNHVT